MSTELQFTLKRDMKIDGTVHKAGPFDIFDPQNQTHLMLLESNAITAVRVDPAPSAKKTVSKRSKS